MIILILFLLLAVPLVLLGRMLIQKAQNRGVSRTKCSLYFLAGINFIFILLVLVIIFAHAKNSPINRDDRFIEILSGVIFRPGVFIFLFLAIIGTYAFLFGIVKALREKNRQGLLAKHMRSSGLYLIFLAISATILFSIAAGARHGGPFGGVGLMIIYGAVSLGIWASFDYFYKVIALFRKPAVESNR